MMLNRIMECENRILQDRQLLNDLIKEYRAGNGDPVSALKLEELQREINYMNQQLAALREGYGRQRAGGFMSGTQRTGMQTAGRMDVNVLRQPGGQMTEPPNMQLQKKQDMEKAIGKSLMGVCASVLIFVSLILVAMLVVPYLTDTMKMVLMFGVSLAFAAAGNILLLKDDKNKWFLSIAGCGVGAVYLSLLVSRIYFGALTDIALYLCILAWAAVVSMLARVRSRLFLIIGQSGVLISVIFGVAWCCKTGDGAQILFLTVYLIIAETVFYLSDIQKEYGRNLLNHIFAALSLTACLFTRDYVTSEAAGILASVLVTAAACMLIAAGIFYFRIRKEDEEAFGILSTIYFAAAAVSFDRYFKDFGMLMAAIAVVFLVGMECQITGGEEEKNSSRGKRIFQTALFIFIYIQIMNHHPLSDYSSTAVPAILCLLYGFFRDRGIYKTAGVIYGLWAVLIPTDGYCYLFWGSAVFAAGVLMLCRHKEQYRTWMKLTAYPLFVYFVLRSVYRIMMDLHIYGEWMEQLCSLTIAVMLNICAMKLPVLVNDIRTGREERAFAVETGICHGICMLVALVYIRLIEPAGCHMYMIMLAILIFTVNIRKTLLRWDGRWSSIYVGSKLLVLVLVILSSFSVPDYVFSMTALLFAALFIAGGFIAQKRMGRSMKEIRIYGLVLSLLSIVKLLLLDIHYDNMLFLAVSFFISGLLCFFISFIYNLVDRKVKNNGRMTEE